MLNVLMSIPCMSSMFRNESMYTGLWTDVRQRPGLLMRSLTPGFPYPPENVTALIANAISLLEDNYAAIKQEVLRLTHVCLYASLA